MDAHFKVTGVTSRPALQVSSSVGRTYITKGHEINVCPVHYSDNSESVILVIYIAIIHLTGACFDSIMHGDNYWGTGMCTVLRYCL